MTSKSSLSYLVQSSAGIYYFRIRIPKRIRILYNSHKKEIKRSLGTRDFSAAVRKARYAWVMMEDSDFTLGSRIERMERELHEDSEGKNLLYEYLVVEMSEKRSYFKGHNTESPLDIFVNNLSVHGVAVLNDQLEKWYKLPQLVRNKEIKNIAEKYNIENISEDECSINEKTHGALIASRFIDYIENYTEIKSRSGKPIPSSTLGEYKGIFDEFLFIVGADLKCSDLNKDIIKKYRDSIWKVPANYKRKQKYKNKAIDQILKMKISDDDKRSVATYNKHALRIKQFLKWAGKEGHIASGLDAFIENIEDSVNDNEKRDSFTSEELGLLFNNEVYEKGIYKKPSQYWLPLLALFTGARGREIAQLYTDDIEKSEDTDVYIIRIRSNEEWQQHLKNKSANRAIPIHKKLIALGFLDYVNSCKVGSMLFSELKSESGNPFKIFGNNFNRKNKSGWKWKHGVKRDKTSFHSFRHNVIDSLVKADIDERMICSMVGHLYKGQGLVGNYIKPENIKKLKAAIDTLEYSSVKWRKIRKWST